MIKSFEKTENGMWNAFICGGELYFFDFYLDLNLYFLHKHSTYFNRLNQQIELRVWNNFSQEKILIDFETIALSDVSFSSLFPSFGLFIIGMLVLVYLITNSIQWCGKAVKVKEP